MQRKHRQYTDAKSKKKAKKKPKSMKKQAKEKPKSMPRKHAITRDLKNITDKLKHTSPRMSSRQHITMKRFESARAKFYGTSDDNHKPRKLRQKSWKNKRANTMMQSRKIMRTRRDGTQQDWTHP